jgi:gluconolactonase
MRLLAFDVSDDGSLSGERELVNFGEETGIDGMTMDVEGHIYAAVRSESRFGIAVFSDEGEELAFIPTRDLPTNCCFGKGDDATTLYVTAGGGLFRIRMGIAGFHPSGS